MLLKKYRIMQRLKKWTLYAMLGVSFTLAIALAWTVEWKPLAQQFGLPSLFLWIPLSILGPVLVHIALPLLIRSLERWTYPIVRLLNKLENHE